MTAKTILRYTPLLSEISHTVVFAGCEDSAATGRKSLAFLGLTGDCVFCNAHAHKISVVDRAMRKLAFENLRIIKLQISRAEAQAYQCILIRCLKCIFFLVSECLSLKASSLALWLYSLVFV